MLRRNGDSDNQRARSSTNIEILITYAPSSDKLMCREEPDYSDHDNISIPVEVLVSNINPFASENLAENIFSLAVHDDQTSSSYQGIAHRSSVERLISGPLTEYFVHDFEDIGDSQIETDEKDDADDDGEVEDGEDGEEKEELDFDTWEEEERGADKEGMNISVQSLAQIGTLLRQ